MQPAVPWPQHRLPILGNGSGPIYVAQAQFNVADAGQNEI
jgi:hypothetical protein